MKNNKGITLIALVVTIIVLLILAGVSIAMLTGDNGILSRASQSSVANAIGEGKDQVGLKVAECTSDYYDWKYNGATVSGLTKGDPNANPATADTTLTEYITAKLNDNSILLAEDFNNDKYCVFYMKQFYYEYEDLPFHSVDSTL